MQQKILLRHWQDESSLCCALIRDNQVNISSQGLQRNYQDRLLTIRFTGECD